MGEDVFFSLQSPLEAVPSNGQTRAALLSGFSDFVRALDGNPRWILEQHGLDVSALQHRDLYIDVQAFIDVFEHCASLFHDRLFGLHMADRQGSNLFGYLTALCRAAPTIKDALTLFGKYLPIAQSPVTNMELLVGKETAELRYGSVDDFGVCDQANYQGVLLQMHLLQEIGGPRFQISYVNLNTRARSRDIADIEKILGCRFYTASINAVAFPARLLDQPTVNPDRVLFRLLSGYLDRVKAVSRISIAQRVEEYIRGALPSGICTIKHCAKGLGFTERTLQVHLSENGVRFSEILEQQRIKIAKSYLEQPELTLDEIAFRLGYSEQSAFGRAFKRWTGSTPREHQMQMARRQNSLAA
jgi:AraC-like DNA-binding protein